MMIIVGVAMLCFVAADNSDWEAYKLNFDKTYSDIAAESRALECYRQNLKEIDELQSLNSMAEFGENPFTDQCYEDFLRERTNGPVPDGVCYKSPGPPPYSGPVDKTKATDWRDKGYVNAVKDQKACGSCWAFSAIANMEAAWFRKTGNLLQFSEQELVSCDTGGQDNGCNGGGPDTAFGWTIKNGGIALESDYPYTGKDDKCNSAAAKKHAGVFSKFDFLDTQRGKNETVLLAVLQNEQPISIYLDATKAWHNYKGGIVSSSACGASSGSVNHAVVIVGYGVDGGTAYWIVRNSWASKWGESGYIRLAFGQNTCNLATCFAEYITAK